MRFFNKYYFAGLGSGIVLTILVIVIFAYIQFKQISQDVGTMTYQLPLPTFPTSSQRSIYGQVDYSWSLQSLEGTEVELSQFRGKVIFLNLWATWCGPCVAEMPSIQELYNLVGDEGIVFLMISDEDRETVGDFVEKEGFSFPVYLSQNKIFDDDDFPDLLKTRGIPTTYIIDSDGWVIFRHVGSAKWDDESCRDFLQSLI